MRKTYHPTETKNARKRVFSSVPLFGTCRAEAQKEFQAWALAWLGDKSCDFAAALYEKLIGDDDFSSFKYDGRSYSFELSDDSKEELIQLFFEKELESISCYLSKGFSVYVFYDNAEESVDFTVFSGNTKWNYECGDELLYVIPAFEGGYPEMVNDHVDLLDEEELREYESITEDDRPDESVFLEARGSSIAERQIEAWIDNFYSGDYRVYPEEEKP